MMIMAGSWALNLFDRLHIGHHVLLDRLCDMRNPIACITDGELLGSDIEYESLIQPIDLRKKNLRKYLDSCVTTKHVDIEVITSYDELLRIKGTTTFLMFEGPCCTEIQEHALDVREQLSFVRDEVYLLKPVMAADGDKMSSARIRKGELDRKGRKLRGTSEVPRKLPDEMRSDLKVPKGQIFAVEDGPPEERVAANLHDLEPSIVVAVGDVTSETVTAAGYTPDVCIVDGITRRGNYDLTLDGDIEYTIYNPAATVYPEAWSVIDTAIHDKKKSLVFVEGEEDLMGFPAVLLAPEGAVMLYGQPDVGIIWVSVNDDNAKAARNFINHMPIIN
ncbi:DUF359 domain-containing protein [Candidatus Thorarchaeota archaeon]|nr:MAG: DUF359 domain-containing protein [Candidatus Thorarchaeota archaeon]